MRDPQGFPGRYDRHHHIRPALIVARRRDGPYILFPDSTILLTHTGRGATRFAHPNARNALSPSSGPSRGVSPGNTPAGRGLTPDGITVSRLTALSSANLMFQVLFPRNVGLFFIFAARDIRVVELFAELTTMV